MTVTTQHTAADSIRAALRAVFAGREYRWQGPSSGWLWLMDHLQRLLEWLSRLRVSAPFRYYLLVAALGLILAMLLAQVLRAARYSLAHRIRPREKEHEIAPRRDAAWHLAAAARYREAGRYPEALAHRFAALLLELEQQRVLKFDPSKTPAEYVAIARLDAVGKAELAALVGKLYRYVFGGAPCDESAWRGFDAEAGSLGSHAAAG